MFEIVTSLSEQVDTWWSFPASVGVHYESFSLFSVFFNTFILVSKHESKVFKHFSNHYCIALEYSIAAVHTISLSSRPLHAVVLVVGPLWLWVQLC